MCSDPSVPRHPTPAEVALSADLDTLRAYRRGQAIQEEAEEREAAVEAEITRYLETEAGMAELLSEDELWASPGLHQALAALCRQHYRQMYSPAPVCALVKVLEAEARRLAEWVP